MKMEYVKRALILKKEKILIGIRDFKNLKSYVINIVGCMETDMIVL